MFRRKGPSNDEIAKEHKTITGITQELSKALKAVQKENINATEKAVYSTDTVNAICNCLEAIFLHGLKANTVSKDIFQLVNYVGQQTGLQTKINFWSFVEKFTHSEVVSHLKQLAKITTDIGLCRAWVRVALNDGVLESYVDAMVRDNKTLDYYYQRFAYLRDSEQPGIMKTYLKGLMNFEFKLSYNANVLNEWSYTPLLLAGIMEYIEAPSPVIKPTALLLASSKSSPTLRYVSVEVQGGSSGGEDVTPSSSPGLFESSAVQVCIVPSSEKHSVTPELISRNVGELKQASSSNSKSECSSISNEVTMIISPALTVQQVYGGSEGSSISDKLFVSEDDLNDQKNTDMCEEDFVAVKVPFKKEYVHVTEMTDPACFPAETVNDELQVKADNVGTQDLCEIDSVSTTQLLNLSEKVLEELAVNTTSKMSSNIENKEHNEATLKVTEKVKDTDSSMVNISPRKKMRDKNKNLLADRPKLSFSPTPTYIPEPETVSKEVNKIRTLENPDYLLKHRHSLPGSLMHGNSHQVRHNKSMPNFAEAVDTLFDHQSQAGSIENMLSHCAAFGEHLTKSPSNDSQDNDVMTEAEEEARRRMLGYEHRESIGNNLSTSGRGWSSSFDKEADDTVDDHLLSVRNAEDIKRPKADSFGTLLQNYTPTSSLSSVTPSSFNDFTYSPVKRDSPSRKDFHISEGYEVISESEIQELADDSRMDQYFKQSFEQGFSLQNFKCKGCGCAIGILFGSPRVCEFDLGYYCNDCHVNDEIYIPLFILHNWNFKKFTVCRQNYNLLKQAEDKPYFNIGEMNPKLYGFIPSLSEAQSLRQQLIYIKTYLFTCTQSIAEEFRKLFGAQDYMYESTEVYSLSDLVKLETGSIARSLRKALKFAMKHIYSCRLCSQKGFICEVCNNPKVIYAFEIDTTFRCKQCHSVFHKKCKNYRPCPKCERRLQRQGSIFTAQLSQAYD